MTKTRAPYMICVELFRPHEEFIINEPNQDQKWNKRRPTIKDIIIKNEKEMSQPLTVEGNLKLTNKTIPPQTTKKVLSGESLREGVH